VGEQAGHVDDALVPVWVRASLPEHAEGQGLATEDGAVEVGVEDRGDLVLFDHGQEAALGDAGAVDEDIYSLLWFYMDVYV